MVAGPARGTISSGFVVPAVDCLRIRGVDVDEVLSLAGIPAGLLSSLSPFRVTAKQYSALWKLVIHHLDDEFFGQDSRRMKPGSFALMARAAAQCESLEKALNLLKHFFNVYLDDLSLQVQADPRRLRLSIVQSSAIACKPFAHETLLVMVHGLVCWLVGRRIPIVDAAFGYAQPEHFSEYYVLFGTQIAFSRPSTYLEFDIGVRDFAIVQTPASLKEFLRGAPENILVKYKNKTGLTARIRNALKASLPGALPNAVTMSRRVHMTISTLTRRLRAEGHSYRSVKDELRRDLAFKFLLSSDKSLPEIASSLGYLDVSSFHRAFQKWTGDSPASFRINGRWWGP